MRELIDRQALKDYVSSLSTHPLNEWDTWGVIAAIDKQPTVTASQWHRVEEELPNDGEWAIFTYGKVVSVERFKVDAYNHFFPASEWFDFEDAIAWMPLPEPPKEVQE